jgi:hypothetical protein
VTAKPQAGSLRRKGSTMEGLVASLGEAPDKNQTKPGPEMANGRELVGVDLWHAAHDARR